MTHETETKTTRLLSRDRVIKIELCDNGEVLAAKTNIRDLDGVLVVVEGRADRKVGDASEIGWPGDLTACRMKISAADFPVLREAAVRKIYSREKWAQAVADGETDLGYEAWLKEVSK